MFYLWYTPYTLYVLNIVHIIIQRIFFLTSNMHSLENIIRINNL